jgi:hypothetical protein
MPCVSDFPLLSLLLPAHRGHVTAGTHMIA